MDYNRFQRILDAKGLSNDPAIKDPNFMVRIDELPIEYRDKALGLYYPDCPDNPSLSRLWVPPDADDETVKHEIGHRIGHYYYNNVSEPFAESYRKSRMSGAVMLSKPVMNAGSYINIASVTAPSSANPGETVNVSVVVKNTYSSSITIAIVGVIGDTDRFIDWIYLTLQSGKSSTVSGSFVMPSSDTVINIYPYYYATDGEYHADWDATTSKNISVEEYTGNYSQIISINSPSSANPGETVNVSVVVKNTYSSSIKFLISGIVENTNRFIDNVEVIIPSGSSKTLTGSFVMPSNATVINVLTYYYGNDNEYHFDMEANQTINAVGSYQIPSDYKLGQYVFYPYSSYYIGKEVQMCTFAFSAPLTIIPGVSWLVNKMIGAYVNGCVQNNAIPIQLKVYSRPGGLGSTDYIVQATATPKSVVTYQNPAMLAPLAWGLIIGVVAGVVGITLLASSIYVAYLTWGGDRSNTETTTTEPTEGDLNPNQSLAIDNGQTTIQNGSSPSTVVDEEGNSSTVPAGGNVILGPGDTFVAGDDGATYTTAGVTTTTKSPASLEEKESSIMDTIKYVAISGMVIAGTLAIASVIKSFKK